MKPEQQHSIEASTTLLSLHLHLDPAEVARYEEEMPASANLARRLRRIKRKVFLDHLQQSPSNSSLTSCDGTNGPETTS